MQYSLNYSGTRFCPLEIKISQFPGGFCLNFYSNPPSYRGSQINQRKLVSLKSDLACVLTCFCHVSFSIDGFNSRKSFPWSMFPTLGKGIGSCWSYCLLIAEPRGRTCCCQSTCLDHQWIKSCTTQKDSIGKNKSLSISLYL